MSEKESLNIDGPYSPISLDKVIKIVSKDKKERGFTVLIDQSGDGFKNDCENMASISIRDRIEQTEYLANWIENEGSVPDYLYKYLAYFFGYISSKDLDEEIVIKPEWKEEFNSKIKYWENNTEIAQLTGLIVLFYEALEFEKKFGNIPHLYIEQPETSISPKREASLMLVLNHILNQFKK